MTAVIPFVTQVSMVPIVISPVQQTVRKTQPRMKSTVISSTAIVHTAVKTENGVSSVAKVAACTASLVQKVPKQVSYCFST